MLIKGFNESYFIHTRQHTVVDDLKAAGHLNKVKGKASCFVNFVYKFAIDSEILQGEVHSLKMIKFFFSVLFHLKPQHSTLLEREHNRTEKKPTW